MDPGLAELMRAHGVAPAPAVGTPAAPGEVKPPVWAIAENRFLTSREQMKKRIRATRAIYIKPENALTVIRRLPEGEGDRTHCILKGDFVLGDLLPYLLEHDHCPHLRIATLGMSRDNGAMLARLRKEGKVGRLTLVLSHYFAGVDKSTVYADVREALHGLAEIAVLRSHAKVICCERSGRDWLVLEGSANLRSSDNLEQMTIFNDREVHDYHAEWIDHVLAHPPAT